MNDITIINDFKTLELFCKEIIDSKTDMIGLDFEGEFNLHRYGIHLCLIQIAFDENIYIIDPVVISDLSPLKVIFESTAIEKVIYACNIDVRLLKFTHDIHIKNIFDLRAAAIILRFEETGLSSLIYNNLGISMEKDKKCQKSNWNKRPLTEEQIEYAGNDVLYLIPLRHTLLKQLNDFKIVKQFYNNCKRLEKEVFTENDNKYTRVSNYSSLSKNERIFLKHFYNAREAAAMKLNFPPFWVLGKDELVVVAKSPPKTIEEWAVVTNLKEKGATILDLFVEATNKALEEIKKK
ncbi:MAG: hypothetical protein A2015_17090 [Spirochaetes bacterium GWF1_31_7]|nr:MAG: hypothetical protein A2Y30_14455 [Spirochaetes bacterium GWE1_32_154]OHD50157.1 MAG: hypothetical protein A2Y29_12500 [Spirochaetes bacterium GWE2_31_10]OHD52471.1 MAG: hypothetical protein A2015_17090 [Spirochaetes bacterium GWF1_31_7]OHD81534.1 MAG: hypothetical protein A2355_15595 [Spirochaetes bacterium RIFOXYB1_FULL_32_8]HBD94115.1 hypothetical protein [Spirochaetia bacterium]